MTVARDLVEIALEEASAPHFLDSGSRQNTLRKRVGITSCGMSTVLSTLRRRWLKRSWLWCVSDGRISASESRPDCRKPQLRCAGGCTALRSHARRRWNPRQSPLAGDSERTATDDRIHCGARWCTRDHYSGDIDAVEVVAADHPVKEIVDGENFPYLGQRWGQRTKNGRIVLHWAVFQLPAHLVDLVVVHELAHLTQPQHGLAFHRLVGRVLPDHAVRSEELAVAGRAVWVGEVSPR